MTRKTCNDIGKHANKPEPPAPTPFEEIEAIVKAGLKAAALLGGSALALGMAVAWLWAK